MGVFIPIEGTLIKGEIGKYIIDEIIDEIIYLDTIKGIKAMTIPRVTWNIKG